MYSNLRGAQPPFFCPSPGGATLMEQLMSAIRFLGNRHVVVAMLVAPLLAVLAWFAVGWLAGDVPDAAVPAQAGQAYPLVEQSGCRYAGGRCRLRNNDVSVDIRFTSATALQIESAQTLDSVLIGLRSEAEATPIAAAPVDAGQRRWRLTLPAPPDSGDHLRLVANGGGVSYYGEASLVFTTPAAP